jgi:hypothetical protein
MPKHLLDDPAASIGLVTFELPSPRCTWSYEYASNYSGTLTGVSSSRYGSWMTSYSPWAIDHFPIDCYWHTTKRHNFSAMSISDIDLGSRKDNIKMAIQALLKSLHNQEPSSANSQRIKSSKYDTYFSVGAHEFLFRDDAALFIHGEEPRDAQTAQYLCQAPLASIPRPVLKDFPPLDPAQNKLALVPYFNKLSAKQLAKTSAPAEEDGFEVVEATPALIAEAAVQADRTIFARLANLFGY